MPKDKKKKEKKDEEKDKEKPPFWFPFMENMDEEQRAEMNKQMQRAFEQIGKMFSQQFNNMDLTKMFENISKNMFSSMDPEIMKNFNEDTFKEMMKKQGKGKNPMGPFVFGLNMKMGPNGMPQFVPFGNVKQQDSDEEVPVYEVHDTREPLTDVIEEEDEVIVVAEMPGCSKENIELKANDMGLTIIGRDEEGKDKFETTVELPSKVNLNRAKANYRNGILEIRLNKI